MHTLCIREHKDSGTYLETQGFRRPAPYGAGSLAYSQHYHMQRKTKFQEAKKCQGSKDQVLNSHRANAHAVPDTIRPQMPADVTVAIRKEVGIHHLTAKPGV